MVMIQIGDEENLVKNVARTLENLIGVVTSVETVEVLTSIIKRGQPSSRPSR